MTLRRRQASEQWTTSSQTFAQTLRQAKGRPQTAQVLVGRSPFFLIRGMTHPCERGGPAPPLSCRTEA